MFVMLLMMLVFISLGIWTGEIRTDRSVLLAHLNRNVHACRVVAAKGALDGKHAPPQQLGVDFVVISHVFDAGSQGSSASQRAG